MMVLDASTALALVLPDENGSLSETGAEIHNALAPSLWPYEVLSGIRAAQARGRLTPVDADEAARLLATLEIEYVHPQFEALLALSHSTGLSIYDASYLALAIRHSLPLATRDQKLMDVAATLGIETISA